MSGQPYAGTGYTRSIDDRTVLRTAILTAISILREARQNSINNVWFWENRLCELLAKRRKAARKPVDVETMRAQLAELETSWTDDLTPERASAIFEQMVELQAAIEKADGAMGDWMDNAADARREARFGVGL